MRVGKRRAKGLNKDRTVVKSNSYFYLYEHGSHVNQLRIWIEYRLLFLIRILEQN